MSFLDPMEEEKADEDTLGPEVCLQQCDDAHCFAEILLMEAKPQAMSH